MFGHLMKQGGGARFKFSDPYVFHSNIIVTHVTTIFKQRRAGR